MTVPPRAARRTGVLVVVLVVCLVLASVLAYGVISWLGISGSDGEASPTSTPAADQSAASRSSSSDATAGTSRRSSTPPESSAPPRATRAPGRPGWVALRTADGWSYQVPEGGGWTSSQDVMAYVDSRGKVLVRATAPSYLNAGACRNPRSVARGVVGWAGPEAGKGSAEVAKNWGTAVAVRDDGSQDRVSRVVTRPIRNAQLEIEHSVVMVSLEGSSGCLARRIQVSATSYRGEGGTRTLVIVRDLGVAGAMSTAVKGKIVRGVAYRAG